MGRGRCPSLHPESLVIPPRPLSCRGPAPTAMPRLLTLALALGLAACADDAPTPPDAPPADAPMTCEDSAAVLQAQIDSLSALVEHDQQRVDAGFRDLDSLRGRIDDTAEGVEDVRRRAQALDAEIGGQ